MKPRKNPYALKGFMKILQGNTSKQEEPKKEEKKDQKIGCGCLIIILIFIIILANIPESHGSHKIKCIRAVENFCKVQAYNPDGLKFKDSSCEYLYTDNDNIEWYEYNARLVGTNAFGGTISNYASFKVLYSIKDKKVIAVTPK